MVYMLFPHKKKCVLISGSDVRGRQKTNTWKNFRISAIRNGTLLSVAPVLSCVSFYFDGNDKERKLATSSRGKLYHLGTAILLREDVDPR